MVTVPVAVIFLNDPASLFESTTTALLAATVPFVMPSIFSRSVSLISAEPITNDPAVMLPLAVTFLRPDATSADPSNTNALFAAPAPFVIPSIFSRSVSFISALPITNDVAVTAPNVPISFDPSNTTALFAAAVPFVMPSSFSRSVSFIDADPIINEPVASTSAFTTTLALKLVASLTSIALESIALISDINRPPTTSKPSSILIFVESVDFIEFTSKVAVVIVPVAVMFLNDPASLFPSTTTALLAATVPLVIPSNFSRSVSFMSAEPIINEPVAVTFLKSPMSLLESTTTALLAATVPAVTPSIVSSSDSFIAADPIVNPAAVTAPVNVGASAIEIVICAPLSVEVETLVPPWKNNLSVPSVISISVESSPSTFNVPPPAFASTYAFTDCCVGINVAELDDMSSSSTKAVTVIVPSDREPN